jgi:hypothetical protein
MDNVALKRQQSVTSKTLAFRQLQRKLKQYVIHRLDMFQRELDNCCANLSNLVHDSACGFNGILDEHWSPSLKSAINICDDLIGDRSTPSACAV